MIEYNGLQYEVTELGTEISMVWNVKDSEFKYGIWKELFNTIKKKLNQLIVIV